MVYLIQIRDWHSTNGYWLPRPTDDGAEYYGNLEAAEEALRALQSHERAEHERAHTVKVLAYTERLAARDRALEQIEILKNAGVDDPQIAVPYKPAPPAYKPWDPESSGYVLITLKEAT